jgi:protein-tyrosine-phosphatase
MRILMVCTGNTCRSPLAEVLMRARLQDTPSLADVTVASAGTSAWAGTPASEGSYLIALERGLDLSAHRATALTAEMVEAADLILTMGRSHAAAVAALGGAGKVHTLVDFAGRPTDMAAEVADPIGGDVEAYRHTANVIDRLLELAVQRLVTERAG